MMYFKSYKAFSFGYFWSFGVVLAIFFPPILYSFDRFRFYQYILNHMLMMLMYFYMYFVHEFKPTFNGYKKSIILILSIAPFMYILNYFTGANFFILSNSEEAPFEWIVNLNGILYSFLVVVIGISLFSLGNIHYLFTKKPKPNDH